LLQQHGHGSHATATDKTSTETRRTAVGSSAASSATAAAAASHGPVHAASVTPTAIHERRFAPWTCPLARLQPPFDAQSADVQSSGATAAAAADGVACGNTWTHCSQRNGWTAHASQSTCTCSSTTRLQSGGSQLSLAAGRDQ